MGSGYSKMKKQAKMMQQQMDKAKENLQKIQVEGAAGRGLVKLTLNGEKEIKNISIDPDCVDPEDVEGLQDLIIAAFEDAYKKIEKQNPVDTSLPFGL